MSRTTAGYLLTSLNLCPSFNCFFTRSSSLQRSLISGSSILMIAKRSSPNPNAQPLYFSGSTPKFWRTLPLTIPEPTTSTHFPFTSISSSTEGSVKGKVSSLKRYLISFPKIACAIFNKTSCKSVIVIILSSRLTKYQPSI